MQKLMDWLKTAPQNNRETVGYVLLAALMNVALSYTVRSALINWGIVEFSYNGDPQHPFKYFNVLTFVSVLVMAPLFEEAIFRLVPLTLVTFFTRKPSHVLLAVAVFAALFGSMHPYSAIGQTKVAIAGAVFGIIFLKCGALQGKNIRGWVCAMAAHGASNLFMLAHEYYEYLELTLY